jgi:hypothetical protein
LATGQTHLSRLRFDKARTPRGTMGATTHLVTDRQDSEDHTRCMSLPPRRRVQGRGRNVLSERRSRDETLKEMKTTRGSGPGSSQPSAGGNGLVRGANPRRRRASPIADAVAGLAGNVREECLPATAGRSARGEDPEGHPNPMDVTGERPERSDSEQAAEAVQIGMSGTKVRLGNRM